MKGGIVILCLHAVVASNLVTMTPEMIAWYDTQHQPPLCIVSPLGAFSRGETYTNATCPEYATAISDAVRSIGAVAWLCWLADPCWSAPAGPTGEREGR